MLLRRIDVANGGHRRGRTRRWLPTMAILLGVLPHTAAPAQVELWLTDPAGTARFERRPLGADAATAPGPGPIIQVDPARTYQTIDGFGYTLTGGSAGLMRRMSPTARAALLKELFSTEGVGLGISYLRLSIGASDLNDRVFSYDDAPAGDADPELKRFDLGPDRLDVIPTLKEILEIAPEIKLMGSPWSPPAWMKSNGKTMGGSLRPEFRGAYAAYLVKYILAMRAEGIRIDAITVQNEPLHPGNNPSLLMKAEEQAAFVRDHLGPAFRKSGIDTKIVVYDHNCDRPEYPLAILADPEARRYIDGSAFHLYAGKIAAMSRVHEAHPDKNLYFTEQWVGGPGDLAGDLAWHTRELTIGATRNWSRTMLQWNLAADPRYRPHTPGGCTRCLGAITIDGNTVTRNPAYYTVAHASKFVRPGSVRVHSNEPPGLPNVAFRSPDGRRIVIILNDGKSTSSFQVHEGRRSINTSLPAGAVGTFVVP
ncbi:glycoside hydrolase family 30 protein [Aquisphaera insulae]|uniref:glycoside hydrolase family 30 protein n=1 Tax=Aquisphaera insulae TaxID=2712864 RepID=UPI0013EB2451|nr:glycoside hydrolase family 30 beta sandwich domain-containing protein [Aquisphaera insulae]